MKSVVKITEQGKKELERELAELIAKRPEIVERIVAARSFGDLSENEEYSSARAEQKATENRIAEIEELLKNAKLISLKVVDKVVLGVTVVVENKGREIEYVIVGTDEVANSGEGKISDASPLGKALLGKKVGEVAEIETPRGKNEFKVVEIR
jgi:transcription elongation factor GreA